MNFLMLLCQILIIPYLASDIAGYGYPANIWIFLE